MISHVRCLSDHFLKESSKEQLLPDTGHCPVCNINIKWVEIASTARHSSYKPIAQSNCTITNRIERPMINNAVKSTNSIEVVEIVSSEEDEVDYDIPLAVRMTTKSLSS